VSIFFGRRRVPAIAARSELHPWGFPYSGLDEEYPAGYASINLSGFTAPMASIALRSTADLIASTISELPVHTYRQPDQGKNVPVQMTTPGYLDDPAGDGHGLEDWLYQLILSWLMRGNVYGDILAKSPLGFPTQILWFYPDDVTVQPAGKGDTGYQWVVNGRPVTNERDFAHYRVNSIPGQLLGLSPIAQHAAQIGTTIAASRFGLQWFTDGAHPSGMLTNEIADLNTTSIRKAKNAFLQAMRGTREPIVLGRGWKWQALQVSPEESQFLNTIGMSEAQAARIFGPGYAEIFGYETGGQSTYANIEGRSALLLVYSLGKWINRANRVLSRMMPKSQFARLDPDALLRTTTLDRYKAHDLALKGRWKVVNEVRKDEDMEPVEWGDEPNPVAGAAGDSSGDQQGDTGNDQQQGAQS
jgi:HK97 family phage portal protein